MYFKNWEIPSIMSIGGIFMIVLKLGYEFLKIGAFSFGGGLATLPHLYVLAEKTGWVSEGELTNMITISQITPGPLACNTASYVGIKIGGIIGAVISNVAFIIPAIIFTGIIYKILDKFKDNKNVDFVLGLVRATAFATVIYGSLTVFKNTFFYNSIIHYKSIILAIALLFVSHKKKIPITYSMIFCGIIGAIFRF